MRTALLATQLILALTIPAAAQTQPQVTPEQRSTIETACRSDVEKHCKNIQPGGGRVAVCLRENQDKVSATCKDAVAKVRAAR